MAREGEFRGRFYCRAFIAFFVLTVFFHCGYAYAVRSANASELARYRVFPLKNITGEQGKKFLTEAQIGTVSQLPKSNTLLVTAKRGELIKVSAILKLVDSKEPFVIKTISTASKAEQIPSNEQIAAELGDVSIGSFTEVAEDGGKERAIIDIHNGSVIAVAEAGQFERIVAAIEKLQKAGVKAAPPTRLSRPGEPKIAEPIASEIPEAQPAAKPAEAEANEPFGRLLDLLADAEKKEEKESKKFAEPVKPAERLQRIQRARDAAREAALQKGPKAEPLKSERVFIEPVVDEKGVPAEVTEMDYTQRSYDPNYGRIAEKDLELDLDLPEQLNIVDLMRLVGEYLELDYMYDPVKVKGTVTLKLRGPIKVKDLYPLLESVLKFKGFVMARKVNLVTIVPAAEAAAIDPTFVGDETGQPRLGDVIITRIFRLEHIDTTSAKNLLDSMGLGVNINTSLSEAKTLIVTGFAYRMGRIEELLQMIDKPGRKKQFRFRQLRYTVAEKLVPKVKALADELGTVSITVSAAPAKPAPKPPRGRRATAKPPTPTAAEPTKPTVYLDTDERTNRVLMIGLDEQLNMVEALIDTLDVEQQDLRTLRLYEIQFVGAEEVMEKLGALGIISGGARTTSTQRSRTTTARTGRAAPSKPAAPTTSAAAEEPLTEEPQVVLIESTNSLLVNATTEQHAQIAVIIGYVDVEPEQASIPYVVYPLENQDPEELADVLNQLVLETTTKEDKSGKIVEKTVKSKTEEQIIIIPDKNTFSIIVYASKKNQQWIENLIQHLDKRRPQVLIDVTLVEVTKNDMFTFNLDLVSKFPTLAPGGSMEKLTSLLTPFPSKQVAEVTSTAAGGSGFYADEHVQALLEVMEEKGFGRVLARPKLLVNDNEVGTIEAQEKKYIVREESSFVPGTEPGTSFQVSKVNFESYDAGITLDIEPHISEGDLLRLKVTLNRTDFRPPKDTTVKDGDTERTIPTPPDTITSKVDTTVTVPDGTTIILGGLEKLSQSKGGTKVPILGDIPIVGGLFRSVNNTDDQSRLYVFVKAHILRPSEEITEDSDIIRISKKNRATFEKYETEMQEYEEWPGFKPKPMDPLKVLEIK